MKLYEGEFVCRLVKLPGTVRAATRLSKDGTDFPNVYINDQLSPPAREKALQHELEHLMNEDFYNFRSIQDVESDNLCHESKSSA